MNTPHVIKNTSSLTKTCQLLMLLVVSVNFLNLATQLSPWLSLLILILLINFYLSFKHPKLRTKRFINLFTVLGAVLLVLLSSQLGLMLTMVNLLLFSHVMKLYEQNHQRDFYVFNLLSLMVLATAMIFHQSLWYFLLFMVLLIICLLPLLYYKRTVNLVIEKERPLSLYKIKAQIIMLSQLLLLSVPLAIFLFFIFPRLQPFAAIPQAKVAKTGLSDQVRVGDVSQLVQSDELAFQVEFTSNNVPSLPMYWRALVMEYFDGNSWQSANKDPQLQSVFGTKKHYLSYLETQEGEPKFLGEPISYQVYVQPSYQPFLFALDVAQPKTTGIERLSDYTIKSPRPISQKFTYEVSSYPDTMMSPELSFLAKKVNLSLPSESNPKMKAFGLSLKNKYQHDKAAPEKIIRDVLVYIRQQPYFYTLSPATLSNDRLDQFFFETREGFCVHYASSFTFLMRAAGIPARLVTGYLGGEYHEQGDFYSIYQKDAHAWTEVWLDKKGWIKVDPTSAVSPERIEQGIDAALFQEQSLLNSGFLGNAKWLDGVVFLKLRATFELIDYQWTKYVVGFTSKKQSKLLQRLFGQEQYWKVLLAITSALLMTFFVVYFITIRRRANVTTSSHDKYFIALRKNVLQKNLPEELMKELSKPCITVRRFCQLTSSAYPGCKRGLSDFYLMYESMQYQQCTATNYHDKKTRLNASFERVTELLRESKS